MDQIKTLATCDEIEFLRQTNKIRKAVQHWLTVTEIQKLRSRLPELEIAPKDATKEQREAIAAKNDELTKKQALENLDAMLDAMLEDHPEETAEIMKLCCFVDPADKTSHHISFYMQAFTEMLQNEAVIGFFISFANVAKRLGLTA
jgi:enamine deaminase RidA (YjgF/YER057c/UK114 family)